MCEKSDKSCGQYWDEDLWHRVNLYILSDACRHARGDAPGCGTSPITTACGPPLDAMAPPPRGYKAQNLFLS